jgi:hypothetical protein
MYEPSWSGTLAGSIQLAKFLYSQKNCYWKVKHLFFIQIINITCWVRAVYAIPVRSPSQVVPSIRRLLSSFPRHLVVDSNFKALSKVWPAYLFENTASLASLNGIHTDRKPWTISQRLPLDVCQLHLLLICINHYYRDNEIPYIPENDLSVAIVIGKSTALPSRLPNVSRGYEIRANMADTDQYSAKNILLWYIDIIN